MDKVTCRYHPDDPLIEDYHAGDIICSKCGLVVGDRVIDVSAEWRTFRDDNCSEDPSRVGGPENLLLGGSDLSTIIGPARGEASFDKSGVSKYHNRRTMSSSDRVLIKAFAEISSMADRLNIPKSIIDRANFLFKQVHDSRNLKGKSNDAIASACLYIACRQDGAARTFTEICGASNSVKRDISRCFMLIRNSLTDIDIDLISTDDYMSRFCSKLGLPNAVQRVAAHIARSALEVDFVAGKSPISIVAAAIYMASQASKSGKTHKEIGNITGVAEGTIRGCYKLMLPSAKSLFPEDFKRSAIARLPKY